MRVPSSERTTRGSRRTLRSFCRSPRCPETISSPSSPTQMQVTCGAPSRPIVERCASAPDSISSRALGGSSITEAYGAWTFSRRRAIVERRERRFRCASCDWSLSSQRRQACRRARRPRRCLRRRARTATAACRWQSSMPPTRRRSPTSRSKSASASTAARKPLGHAKNLGRRQHSRPLCAPVVDRVAEPPRHREQRLEVEVDLRARLLRHLVLDRQIEVVGAVVEREERVLVLRQHRRAHVLHVVEEDPRQCDVAAVLLRGDLAAAERRAVRLVRPAEEREETAGLVLEVACPLQVLEALVERLVEADHHRRRRLQPALYDRALRVEVVAHRVLPLRVSRTEVLGEDLAPASGHPVDAGVAQPRRRIRIRQLRAVGQEHELGDRERVELDAVAVSRTDSGEEVAVVVERQARVEAAVEADEIAADLEQLVDLREDVLARQDVAAVLVREDVERAVVALRDADVRVVDDPHHHVGGAAVIVVARPDLLREPLPLLVARVQPELARAVDVDAVHAATSAGASVSMNELTEKTALPGPGGPYPGGGSRSCLSSVSRDASSRRPWYSSGAPSGLSRPSGVVGSGHHVVKRGVIPRLMKWSSPSVVDAIASSTVRKPNGFAISTPATKFGIT